MIQWAILIAVKGLKFAIFGALALVSHTADLGGCGDQCAQPIGPGQREVIVLSHDAELVPVMPAIPAVANAETVVVTTRAARIQRLVPPVRVEMTFTPDLLHPPTRDPSL